jgi:hypothetical protein
MKAASRSHPEQLLYATVLHWSTLAGFIVLVVTFAAYMFGWLPAQVPLQQLPQLWGMPASEFLKATGMPTGWSWLFMIGKGDFASQLGIATLSGCSIACILAIMPAYARTRNTTYLVICTLEIAVLLVSASGIFTAH